LLAFSIFINRCENGDELASFVKQFGLRRNVNAVAVHEQFQPILRFFNLLEPTRLNHKHRAAPFVEMTIRRSRATLMRETFMLKKSPGQARLAKAF
jgi:hypothetical protein